MNIKPAVICKSPYVSVLHFNSLKHGNKFVCAPANFNDVVMPLNQFKKLIKSKDIEVYIRAQGDDFDGAVSIKTGLSYSLAEIEVEDYRVIKVEI